MSSIHVHHHYHHHHHRSLSSSWVGGYTVDQESAMVDNCLKSTKGITLIVAIYRLLCCVRRQLKVFLNSVAGFDVTIQRITVIKSDANIILTVSLKDRLGCIVTMNSIHHHHQG